jgi:anti-anti-sigma factor
MTLLTVFQTERLAETLVVTPLMNISSLAGDQVQPELERVLAEIDQLPTKNIILDFAKVGYFGSVMLAAAQMLWKRVRNAGGKLVVCNASQVSREVLHVSKFDMIWPIVDTREQAIQSLGG